MDLKSVVRHSPCLSPFKHIYIDYNGNCMPCCNLRSDIKQHQKYILGNIDEDNLCSIYFSLKGTEFRKSVFTYNENAYCSLCNTCNFGVLADNEENRKNVSKKIEHKKLAIFLKQILLILKGKLMNRNM